MPSQDGMNYAPSGAPKPVCSPGDFVFAAVGLDHGHINGTVSYTHLTLPTICSV